MSAVQNPAPAIAPGGARATGGWTLYYDGGCNLCEAAQTTAGRWALRADVPLRTVMLQDPEAVDQGLDPDLMVLDTPEGRFTAADAWLQIVRFGPLPLRPLALLRRTGPTLWLARKVYGFVAARRKAWFGTRECKLPSAAR